jgi:hypothetical protein
MSVITFKRGDHTLSIEGASYTAYNNVDSTSDGPWPNGTFSYASRTKHADDAPASTFGSNGNFMFTVPGRTLMGIHSGRKDRADGLRRKGPAHCTFGCIRTTDEGTAHMARLDLKGWKLVVQE